MLLCLRPVSEELVARSHLQGRRNGNQRRSAVRTPRRDDRRGAQLPHDDGDTEAHRRTRDVQAQQAAFSSCRRRGMATSDS